MRTAPALRRRNSSCRTETGRAGPDQARIDPEGRSVCRLAVPPLVPALLTGPGRGAARAPGGTELGGRVRPPRQGRFRWQIFAAFDSLWGSVSSWGNRAEAPLTVSLGVSLISGLTPWGPSGKERRICMRSSSGEVSVWDFFWERSLDLCSLGGIRGSCWETCLGCLRDLWDLFGAGVSDLSFLI